MGVLLGPADVRYGCRPLFAILDNATHASRKKLFSQMHSKSFMMSPAMETNMKEKIAHWINSFGNKAIKDVRTDVRYITIDVISRHLWGEAAEYKTLKDDDEKQRIDEVINLKNVYLPSWLIHFPGFSWWMEKKVGFLGVNPMHTVRKHAQMAYRKFKAAGGKSESTATVGGKLFTQHVSNGGSMTDDQIAAELGDLFLAGLDTTADTMTCMFWTLSRPEYAHIQEKLRKELQGLELTDGLPSVVETDKLLYLDAVLKETLRIFPINAGSQPRIAPAGKPVEIYDLELPAGTICEMQAFSVNRESDVFDNPDTYDPERWMIPRDSIKYKEMNRQMWSFSSGQRMCIGQQYEFRFVSIADESFAMVEMQLITATVYRRYRSTISPMTTDQDMELDDQVTLSGPMVRSLAAMYTDY